MKSAAVILIFMFATFIYVRLVLQYTRVNNNNNFSDSSRIAESSNESWHAIGDTIDVDESITTFLSSLQPPGRFFPIVYRLSLMAATTTTRNGGEQRSGREVAGGDDRSSHKIVIAVCGSYELVAKSRARKIAEYNLPLYDDSFSAASASSTFNSSFVILPPPPTEGTAYKFDFHEKGQFTRSEPLMFFSEYYKQTETVDDKGLEISFYDRREKRVETVKIVYPLGYESLRREKTYQPCLSAGPEADFYFLHPDDPKRLKAIGELSSDDERLATNDYIAGMGQYAYASSSVYGHCQNGKYVKETCDEGSFYAGRGRCYKPASERRAEQECIKRLLQLDPTSPAAQILFGDYKHHQGGEIKTSEGIFVSDVSDDRMYFECSPGRPYAIERFCNHEYERFDIDAQKCVLRNPCMEQETRLPTIDKIDVKVPRNMKTLYPNAYITCYTGGSSFDVKDCGSLYPNGILAEHPPFNYCVEYNCRYAKNTGTNGSLAGVAATGNGWRTEHVIFEPNGVRKPLPSTAKKNPYSVVALTTKISCTGGRVIKMEIAQLIERCEYIFKTEEAFPRRQLTTRDGPSPSLEQQQLYEGSANNKFFIKYVMPEFIFDAKTGEKIICHTFRDAPQIFASIGHKLRVYSQLTTSKGPLSFVRLSLYLDVQRNAMKAITDNLLVDCHHEDASATAPILLSSREKKEINERLTLLGGNDGVVYACSWVNKSRIYEYDPSSGLFVTSRRYPVLDNDHYAYYTNSLSAFPVIGANIRTGSVALLSTKHIQLSLPVSAGASTIEPILTSTTSGEARTTMMMRLLAAADGFSSFKLNSERSPRADDIKDVSLLGYVFESQMNERLVPLSEKDINHLAGKCIVPPDDGIHSALLYLKNAFVYVPQNKVWCLNGEALSAQAITQTLPCYSKMGLTFNADSAQILNSCLSLEPFKPSWIEKIEQRKTDTNNSVVDIDVKYHQYVKPTLIANLYTSTEEIPLDSGNTVKYLSTVLSFEEYKEMMIRRGKIFVLPD